MGKRSNFERVDRDFYRTPVDAVAPLWPLSKKSNRSVNPARVTVL